MSCNSASVAPIDAKRLMGLLPFPPEEANKYTRGKAIVVAGSARYPGAALLAARATQRMGAGYTEVYTAAEAMPLLIKAAPSLVVRPFDQLEPSVLQGFTEAKPGAACVGPGFDTVDESQFDLVFYVLGNAQAPVVVDGGALAALCQPRAQRYFERRFAAGLSTVLTPHGGEAARVAKAWGIEAADDAQRAQLLALAFGTIVVHKGPQTYVSDGEIVLLMDEGTSALAKAGTGDVLAGMCTALIAQGIDAFDACALATVLHARAGVAAAGRYTEIGVTAEDIIDALPQEMQHGE